MLWLTGLAQGVPYPAAPHSVDAPAASPQRSLESAHRDATHAAGVIAQHWPEWIAEALRIVLIIVIAGLLRYLIRRSITKLIERSNRRSEAAESGNALRGLGVLASGERRRQRSAAIGSVLRSFASTVIMGTAFLTILSDLGIDLGPLLASAGVAGVALGFGARNLVQDWLAGVFMLLEDQYGVGDRIDVGEATGTVLEIGLRITQLRGESGAVWYIRNGEIKRVGNLSQGWATAVVDVALRPDEDLEAVREAIAEAGRELAKAEPWSELLWDPVQVLGLDSVTLESMVVRASVRTVPGQQVAVERELRWRIKRALDVRGITGLEERRELRTSRAPWEPAGDDDEEDDRGRTTGGASGQRSARAPGRSGQPPSGRDH